MTFVTAPTGAARQLLLPAALLALALGALIAQLGPLPFSAGPATLAMPAIVTLPPGTLIDRPAGTYLQNGHQVDAPLTKTTFAAPLAIMRDQVSAADYARCVTAGACAPAEPRTIGKGDVPATGVSYNDAKAYAAWLSRATGALWTLPTEAEWAYAAADKRTDDALDTAAGDTNPANRWLADYRKEAARKRGADPVPHPLGSFGVNANGLMDMAGNVWEWTDTCHSKVLLDATGGIVSQTPACTIRVLQGQHRTPMSTFIRDARSGGCSVGTPPDNLGFRLVRRPAWYERLMFWGAP